MRALLATCLARRWPVVMLAVALAAPTGAEPIGGPDPASDLGARLDALEDFFLGEARVYRASPELCAGSEGRAAARVSPPPDLEEWRQGRGNCTRAWRPDARTALGPFANDGMLGPAAEGLSVPDAVALLDAAANAVENGIAPLDRLRAQSLFWQLLFGFAYLRHELERAELEALEEAALLALERTLFDDDELAALPDSFERASAAGDGATRRFAEQLRSGKALVLEHVDHSRLYEGLLGARYAERIVFDAGSDDATWNVMGQLTRSPFVDVVQPWPGGGAGKGFESLRELSRLSTVYPRVRSAMILTYNALDRDWRIRPTPVVGAWREIRFRGRATPDGMHWADPRRIEAVEIVHDRRAPGLEPSYVRVDMDGPRRYGMLDRQVSTAGQPVVALRTRSSTCQSCHWLSLRTFATHAERVRIARAGRTSAEENLERSHHRERAEERLGELRERYGP